MKRLLLVLAFALVLSSGAFAEEISAITIEYKDANMTIEFIENEIVIGQATLISHKTYDEVLEIPSGKDRVVIWYEFSEFESIKEDALIGVEFIDLRKEIFDYSGKEVLDISEVNKYIIPNPNYLLPITKNYNFVYLEEGRWLPYNSFDIPKEKIIIGVQTDLNWGEYLDVVLNIMEEKLDKHGVVLGISSGFVTETPVDDPSGSQTGSQDYTIWAIKDTSPATATKIIEIGFWSDITSHPSETITVLLYDENIDTDLPRNLLYSKQETIDINANTWESISVDWDISPNTNYWMAIWSPNINTFWGDYSGGTPGRLARKENVYSLPDPFGTPFDYYDDYTHATYAVWEAGAADTFDFTISMPATCSVNKGCLGAECSTCTRCWAEPTDSIIPIDGNIACQGQDNDTPFLVIDFTGSASTFDLNMFLEETPPSNLYLRVNSNNALATSTRLTNASQLIIADQTPTGTQDANIWVWGEFEAYYPDDLNVSGTTDLNTGEFN